MNKLSTHISVCFTHASSHAIRVIKSRKIKWEGHVERMGEIRKRTKFWSENLKERDHLEDLGVDGKLLEWWEGVAWVNSVQNSVQWRAVIAAMNCRVP
jgi:hypothetical protein